jgi:malonyl-CoA O-methyltransferase
MDRVAGAYDQWSASYDVDHNRTRDLDAAVLRTSGIPVSGADVLEIGCGTGKNTVWLVERARAVMAMDFSPGMLAKARERVGERVGAASVQFVEHDVRTPWPVPSDGIDVVVGNLVLEHVEHVGHVFAEAYRVLRAGGTMYIAELHPYRQWRGGQAHFTAADGGEVVHVPAFVHTVSEYVNAATHAGLSLAFLGEHVEEDAEPGALPRLLTLQCVKLSKLGPSGALSGQYQV